MSAIYLQAYYGQRVTMPPYYNSAVASGHAPHPYMWGPPQVVVSQCNHLCVDKDSLFFACFVCILDDKAE